MAAIVFVLGMVVLVAGLVFTATTVLLGVVIGLVGLLLMIAVVIAVFRWRRRPGIDPTSDGPGHGAG
jgi:hypothetical protein